MASAPPARSSSEIQLAKCSEDLFQYVLDKHYTHKISELMDQHNEINIKLKAIADVQDVDIEPHLVQTDRVANLGKFIEWTESCGITMDKFKIKTIDNSYFALEATQDIEADDLIAVIPGSDIFSSLELSRNPAYEKVFNSNRLLRGMENVRLAFLLCVEYLKPDSKWKPYFDVLPKSNTTPVSYSPSELALLKGSYMYSDALFTYLNHARQFAYILNQITNHEDNDIKHLGVSSKHFTFNLYLWSVNLVSTRVNFIPSPGADMSLAPIFIPSLIPALDFANHASKANTKFVFDHQEYISEIYARQNIKKGEELTITYGNRSNYLLMLCNGFCDEDNTEMDSFKFTLGLPPPNQANQWKHAVVDPRMVFVSSREIILPVSLLEYTRVYIAKTKEEYSPDSDIKKVYEFLKARFSLLKTVLQRTRDSLLQKDNITANERAIRTYLKSEIRMLESTIMETEKFLA
uniref:Protein-histidine N-methyltransferase n=1 Tax=Rhabditophanes sp. KR3021 TaxID=114890 RepID=A0AC35TTP3_9BILA